MKRCWSRSARGRSGSSRSKSARFPDVRNHVPDPESIVTTLGLAEEDAEFLVNRIQGLPRSELKRQAVTLDLNGEVLVRGQGENQPPTELVLSNSQVQGTNLRLNTNREFFLRAARLGFRQIHFTGPELPAFCHEEHKTFVWAVLEKDGVIPPQANTIRVESPLRQPIPTTPSTKRKATPLMTRNHKPDKPPDRNGHPSKKLSEAGGLETLIEHAESLQETLREATVKFRELMTMLKQHRKDSKSVQNVLASLRQLPSLHI